MTVDIHLTAEWQRVRKQAKDRDGWRCRACGRAGRLEVDHVVAVIDGGEPYDLENLQTLCRGCHLAKSLAEREARDPLGPRAAAWARLVEEMRR